MFEIGHVYRHQGTRKFWLCVNSEKDNVLLIYYDEEWNFISKWVNPHYYCTKTWRRLFKLVKDFEFDLLLGHWGCREAEIDGKPVKEHIDDIFKAHRYEPELKTRKRYTANEIFKVFKLHLDKGEY